MKFSCLTLAAICMSCGSLLASAGMAQALEHNVVSIDISKGSKLSDVIRDIETSSGLNFVYNPDLLIDKNTSTGYTYSLEPVRSLLDKLGLSVEERGNYLILNVVKAVQQERIITGYVQDSTGLAMPGVSVKLVGTRAGTITDENGAFKIGVGNNSVLSFSMIGYRTAEVTVGNQQNIRIIMYAEGLRLNDVVVVGYGTQRKATLTGAVSSVSLDKLSSRSVNSVGEVLAGKSPGVVVTNEGGDPTSTPRINIRGMGGINGESVLYVVDGSVFPGTPVLNPNDIESISVLKDAAAAIYGARASGGVVLINTKKGKKTSFNINFDAKFGNQSAWKKLEPLNAQERAMVAATAAKNGGSDLLPSFDTQKYADGQVTRTNWIDEVFRSGSLQDYSASANGGTEKSSFFLSFNYRKSEAIVLNTKSQRYNFRINSEHQLKPWLKLGENISYSYTNGNGANTSSDYTGALLSAIYYPANGTPYNADGSFAGLPGPFPGDYGDIINPVAELKRIDINNPYNLLNVNPYATITIAPGFTFRSNLSITKSHNTWKSFTPKRPEVGKPVLKNSLTESNDRFTDVLAEQVLNYATKINDNHNIALTGGYSYQKSKSDGISITGIGFDDESNNYRYMVNATTIQHPKDYHYSTALSSLFLRANYDFKDRYLLSLIGRRDGSSMLSKDNRFRNYGSVSAGWNISKEPFLASAKWLTDLKIRGSYGVLGNLGSLSASAVNPLLATTRAYFGQDPKLLSGYKQTILANKNLSWADSKQTNIGLDMTVFNRFTLNADYFLKNVKNMILTRSLPGTAGLGSQTINAGLVKDKGFELGLTYNSARTAEVTYSFSASLTKINNKVHELAPGLTNITVGTNFRNELQPIVIRVGQPLYSYYVLKTDGLFKSQAEVDAYVKDDKKIQPKARPGDFKFVDIDGNGTINQDDRYFAGSAYPDFSYGFSFNANYKNFDINVFAQGVNGNKLFNAVKKTTYSASGPSYNKLKGILDAWSETNPNGTVPIISTSDANGNFNASDFYIENGSYLRLRNFTLGYTLQGNVTKQLGIGAVRIYGTANNLFTITKYSGFDPEIGMDNNGMDVGRYPQARSYMLGISINL